MMNVTRWIVLCLGVLISAGCEDPFSSEEDEDVTFVNKSSYTVTVIPQAYSDWSGFKLPPGGVQKLNEPSDVFFTYEPRFRVTIGENEDGRVLFINLKEGTEDASPGT
jgi:hypothetical protein